MFSPTISNRCVILCYQALGSALRTWTCCILYQITSLKSLSINLFLLAWLNFGLQLMRLRVQDSQKALCSKREREGEREREREREKRERERESEREKECCLKGVGTHLLGTVLQGCWLLKWCRNLPAGTVLEGCRLFTRCRNLSAGTVLQGCRLFNGVRTYQPALCCRGAGCLSSVGTYLPALCCRGAAI